MHAYGKRAKKYEIQMHRSRAGVFRYLADCHFYMYFYSEAVGESREKNYHVSMAVPAIDGEGNGIILIITVHALSGTGRILTYDSNIFYSEDTRNSFQISGKIASDVAGIDLSKYDIMYGIEANSTFVEGPSAGAAFTLAAIAAMQNRRIDAGVMITGTINDNGEIGPVSNILQKAMVAKANGAKLLLVPKGQSNEIAYGTKEYCIKNESAQTCSLREVPVRINISEEADIEIMEVRGISDAVKYFIR